MGLNLPEMLTYSAIIRVFVLSALSTAFADNAVAESNVANTRPSVEKTVDFQPAEQVIYIDFNTGKLVSGVSPRFNRGRMALSPQTQQHLSTSGVGLVEQVQSDGSVLVNLQGRFMHFSGVNLNRDKNSISRFCIGNQPVFDEKAGKIVTHSTLPISSGE